MDATPRPPGWKDFWLSEFRRAGGLRQLSLVQYRVLFVLLSYADRRGEAWPSMTTLEAETMMDRSNIQKALRALEGKGKNRVLVGGEPVLERREHYGRGRHFIYTVRLVKTQPHDAEEPPPDDYERAVDSTALPPERAVDLAALCDRKGGRFNPERAVDLTAQKKEREDISAAAATTRAIPAAAAAAWKLLTEEGRLDAEQTRALAIAAGEDVEIVERAIALADWLEARGQIRSSRVSVIRGVIVERWAARPEAMAMRFARKRRAAEIAAAEAWLAELGDRERERLRAAYAAGLGIGHPKRHLYSNGHALAGEIAHELVVSLKIPYWKSRLGVSADQVRRLNELWPKGATS